MNYKVDTRMMNSIIEIRDAIWYINTDYLNGKSITNDKLVKLKNALNKTFKDTNCKDIIFTNNTDKMFFGMCVMPIIKPDELDDILIDDKPFIIKNYCLEIDSKLFDPVLKLTNAELTAIILHEIGHLVNSGAPIEKVRNELDTFLMNSNDNISLSKVEQYRDIILFGIKDAVRKVTSIFENKNKEEILADEFVLSCGYGEELISGLNKIKSQAFNINSDVNNKFVVLTWALRLYKNVGDRRVAAIHTLKKAEGITGSTLVKRDIKNMKNNLDKFDFVRESDELEKRKKYQFKFDILRRYEDDYFEFALRLKNANIEEDALRLLRNLNSRISVIEEFLETVDLQEYDRKRFTKLYDKYLELRDALSKKSIVKDKYIGLWVEYPDDL